MPYGLNTEADPRKLPRGNYAQFQNLSQRSGSIRPRGSDESFTPSPGSEAAFHLARVNTHSVVDLSPPVFGLEKYGRTYEKSKIAVPLAGGVPKIHTDKDDATGVNLVCAAPNAPPVLLWVEGINSDLDTSTGTIWAGLKYAHPMTPDIVFTYTTAFFWEYARRAGPSFPENWGKEQLATHTGPLGEFLEVTNDYILLPVTLPFNLEDFYDTASGVALNLTITNTTKSKTAKMRGVGTAWSQDGVNYSACFIIKRSERGDVAWADGDSITVTDLTSTPQVFTLTNDATSAPGTPLVPVETTARVTLYLRAAPEMTYPTGFDAISLYRYEDESNSFRRVQPPVQEGTFPFTDQWSFAFEGDAVYYFPVWPGPLDDDGGPADLVTDFSNAQAVALHRGSVLMAVDNLLYASDYDLPRYFRSTAKIKFPEKILRMVSRDEYCEVHTTRSVYILQGEAPWFTMDETQCPVGPTAHNAVATSEAGTFFFTKDGIYAAKRGEGITNITKGNNTPWVKAVASPAAVVAGARPGVAYFADATGRVIGYDYETREFFSKTFTKQPVGFWYDVDTGALVVKFSDSTYAKIETGTAGVAWTLQPQSFSQGGIQKRLPSAMLLDGEGDTLVRVYVQDSLRGTMAVSGTGPRPAKRFRLPLLRGGYWHVVLSGTAGTEADTVVRSVDYA